MKEAQRPEDDEEFLLEIFDEVQRSITCHAKCLNEILEHFPPDRNEDLYLTIKTITKHWFLRFKNDLPTRNVEKFLIKLSTTKSMETFCYKFLLRLTRLSNSSDRAMRLRCCRLVGGILSNMDTDAELNENCFETIYEKIDDRLEDKIVQVRKAAIIASDRLQDTEDFENCTIIKKLERIMKFDKDKECRLLAIQHVALSNQTRDMIIERTRAEEPSVRKAVFEKLQNCRMKHFTIEHRTALFRNGLLDRDEHVRASCFKLFGKWLDRMKWDLWKFLAKFDLIEHCAELEEPFLVFLDQFYDDLTIGEFRPPYTKEQLEEDQQNPTLHINRAFFWRILVDWCERDHRVSDKCRIIGDFDIATFCDIFNAHKSHEFIASQLLKLAVHLDFQDEFGRNQMASFCRQLLKDHGIKDELVPDILTVLRKLYVNQEKEFLRVVREDLEEIADPLEQDLPQAELSDEQKNDLKAKLKFNCEKYDMLDKQSADTDKMEAVAGEMEVLHQQLFPAEWLMNQVYYRQIIIITDVFKHTRISPNHPFISNLMDDCIVPILKQPFFQMELFVPGEENLLQPELCFVHTRISAHQAIATYCCLSKQLALDYLWMIFLFIEDGASAAVMFKAIFDFLHLFKFSDDELINAPNPAGDEGQTTMNMTNKRLIEMLTSEFKDSNDFAVRDVCVEGFTRLLQNNRAPYKQKEILVEMMLMYYSKIPPGLDPALHDEISRMHQVLGLFFPKYYSNANTIEKGCKQMLLQVVIECIMAITSAPQGHARRDINRKELIDYVLWLINLNDRGQGKNSNRALHCTLAVRVLSNLEKSFSGGVINWDSQRSFCQLLSKLELMGSKQELTPCQNLITLINVNINDKKSRKDWESFKKNFDKAYALGKDDEVEESSVLNESLLKQIASDAAKCQEMHNRRESIGRRRSLIDPIKSPALNAKKKKLKTLAKSFGEEASVEDLTPAKRENSSKNSAKKKRPRLEESDDDIEELLQE